MTISISKVDRQSRKKTLVFLILLFVCSLHALSYLKNTLPQSAEVAQYIYSIYPSIIWSPFWRIIPKPIYAVKKN